MYRPIYAAGMLLAAFALVSPLAQAAPEKLPALLPPPVTGEINGKSATFSSLGEMTVLSTLEATRLGLPYLQGTKEMAGVILVWRMTLDSVRVGKTSVRHGTAFVVPNVQAFRAYLEKHSSPRLILSRLPMKVNGKNTFVYTAGMAFLMSTAEANRIGLLYRTAAKALPARDGMPAMWGIDVRMAIDGYPETESGVIVVSDLKQFERATDHIMKKSMDDVRRRAADHARKQGGASSSSR